MGSAPDAERLASRARFVREQLDRVRSVDAARDVATFSAPASWMANGAVRHALQTAIEALIDMAYHLSAKRLSAAPQDAYDAFARLAGAGLVPQALLPSVNRMIGFRNRLVHRYLEVDDAQVVAIVRDDLGQVDTVLRALEAAAAAPPPPGTDTGPREGRPEGTA